MQWVRGHADVHRHWEPVPYRYHREHFAYSMKHQGSFLFYLLVRIVKNMFEKEIIQEINNDLFIILKEINFKSHFYRIMFTGTRYYVCSFSQKIIMFY